MPAHARWHKVGRIILYEISDPVTLDDLESGAEQIWALAAEVREPVDMILDYSKAKAFPRGVMPVVRDGHFTLPMLDRVALVGSEPMIEMMMVTITRATFRPDPTVHATIEEAADMLIRIAEDDDM
jgi:hypothetical protein